jgi:hypothetical protein
MLQILDTKTVNENLNKLMKVENVEKISIINDLKYEVYYSFEDIFIRNKSEWTVAIDPKT